MEAGEEQAPEGIDPRVPTAARMYDFMLGGTHNFASNRAAVKQVNELVPELDDPAVAAHSRELGSDPATTAFITSDLKDAVLGHPEFQRVIDLTQPVGIVMTAVFHYILDSHDPDALLAKYVGAVPSSSYLVMSHMTGGPLEPVPGGVWGAENPAGADTEGGRWVHCAVGRKP